MLHNLNLSGVDPKVLTELFNSIDVNRNGSIDYREFKEAFGEGICGGGYEGMDVFHGGKAHLANIACRTSRVGLRDMSIDEAIRELRARMATQHKKVRTAFRALDRDSSGTLEKGELLTLLENYHIKLSDNDMNHLIAQMDTDNSGKISYREFNNYFGKDIAGGEFSNTGTLESALAEDRVPQGFAISESQKQRNRDHHQCWSTSDFMNAMESILMTRSRTVQRIFRAADSDKSGFIDAQEWHNALSQLNLEMSPEKAKEFFDALDKNGDGSINYREFVAAFGDIVAGYRDTGIMTAHLYRQANSKIFGNSRTQPRHVPRVPRYTVSQIKELVAKRLGGKYTSACAAFRNIDINKDGSLDKNEFRHFIKTLNVELLEEDYDMLYSELDRDSSGSIDYKEFLFWFGEAICGAPWQMQQSTGLCTEGVPRMSNRMPTPELLTSTEALRLLHLKLTETSTSVSKVFKRYNKSRSTKLHGNQFKLMFDNYHLHVNDQTVLEIIKNIQCRHRTLPADGSGLDFPLFVKEFGKSIAGEAYVGFVNNNDSSSVDFCKELRPTPKCTAKQARTMLIDKLVTNFKHNRTAFTRFNLAHNSGITLADLRSVLTHYHIHLSDGEFTKLVSEFDKDCNGIINFREFISVVGAEVGGSADHGLSFTMQAADELQQAKSKDLHKALECWDLETPESESDADIVGRPAINGIEYTTKKAHLHQDHKITNEFSMSPANNVKARQCSMAAARRRQQALTISRSQFSKDSTSWDISGINLPPTQPTRILHRKRWRNPPSRSLRRGGGLHLRHASS